MRKNPAQTNHQKQPKSGKKNDRFLIYKKLKDRERSSHSDERGASPMFATVSTFKLLLDAL